MRTDSLASASKLDAAVVALETMAPPPARLPEGPGGQADGEKSMTLSQYAQLWYAGREGGIEGGLNEPMSPFQESLWVYKCIMALGRTASGIPLRLSVAGDGAKYNAKSFRASIRRSGLRTLRPVRGCKGVCVGRAAEGEIVEDGEAYELFERPNSYQDWPKLFLATIGYVLSRGKVAWVMTGMAGRGRRAAEIHCVDGKYIKPVWAKDAASGMPVLLGYTYRPPKTGGEVPLTTDEVKFWAMWDDSDDPLGGLSPIKPGHLAIATDYNASLYNAYSLVNGIEPGLKIKFPQLLDVEQREQFRQSLAMRNRGACRAKRELIMEGGADAEVLGEVLKDQGWNEGKRTTRLEICALFDVPPVVAGWVDAAGDSSAYTANALRQFYMQAIFPLLDGFLPAVQEIVSRFDTRLVAWFDVEDQPVVQEMRLSRIATAKDLFAMAVPMEDINGLLDLGLPDRPQHAVGWLPVNLLPAEQAMTGAALPPQNEGPENETSDEIGQTEAGGQGSAGGDQQSGEAESRKPKAESSIGKEAADQLWRRWQRSWSPLAKIAARLYANHFGAQERLIKKLLRQYLAEGSGERETGKGGNSDAGVGAAKSEGTIARILVEVFDDADAKLKFRTRVERIVT
ncbi:MAG TPA: phage portal protein, partial [Phycisphaerae bacterium]|nr:phage portal protein [Phycisphaerae bacterium]